ncbi:homocysteine S-methyltransferase family protein, partial [Streptomyces sp. NPDC048256]|uniref:homocysteine S-methyltransferase family protein n=1 Tax=unclassified Streptomyces TaxID=2593676 RepID=UPI003400023E
MSAGHQARIAAFREALATRVVVADGAMGTMLQAQEPTLEDFEQLEGCNEILNVTRPDIIAERLIEDLTTNWGIQESDILIDTLTFTICT